MVILRPLIKRRIYSEVNHEKKLNFNDLYLVLAIPREGKNSLKKFNISHSLSSR